MESLPRYWNALVAVALAAAAIGLAYLATTMPFDADEFQHTFLGWQTHLGKVVYRDMFDNHGMLYTYFNGGMFGALSLPAEFSSFFVLRLLNYSIFLLLLAVVTDLGRCVFGSWFIGLLAALLTCSGYVSKFAIQVRPDTLQNLMWFLGLLCAVRATHHRSLALFVWSGVCCGLMFLANPKSSMCLLGLAVGVTAYYRLRKCRRSMVMALASLLSGVAISVAAGLFYLYATQSLQSFWELAFSYNFSLIAIDPRFDPRLAFTYYVTEVSPLTVVAGMVGYAMAVTICLREKVRPSPLLILVVALPFPLLGRLGRVWGQYDLTFFPLLALFGAAALQDVFIRIGAITPKFSPGRAYVPLCVLLIHTLAHGRRESTEEARLLVQQKREFEYINRSKIEGTIESFGGRIGGNCAGHGFRDHATFMNFKYDEMAEAYRKTFGVDPVGPLLVQKLEAEKTPFLVGTREDVSWLPKETLAYIHEHYAYLTCVFVRLQPTS